MARSLRESLVEATGGRYVIEHELGRGGMAVVFAATDVRLKRPVAIKALPPELAFRNDVRTRFMREAQMAASLAHPHIVPIYSVEEHEGLVFMVMGLVRGESLAQRLHREGRMEFGEARRILREAADALSHAHAHGVIHRDIKPDNILIEAGSGRIVVTDFGIARALEGDARITVTGVAVGTPTYMSPEQARGDDDVDGRADVYALGVVGFQMLAGEPPFNAPNTPALLLKHVSEPPPPLRSRRPDTPANLAAAIDRALAKDRERRWPGSRAFFDALGETAAADDARRAGQNVEARPVSVVPPLPPPPPPHPLAPPSGIPPYPVWRGNSAEERERWKAARRAWQERLRAHQPEWERRVRDRLDAQRESRHIEREARHLARDARRRERDAQALREGSSIAARVRRFQRHVISNLLFTFVLFVINAATGGFPWFFFPALAMAISVIVHGLQMWQDGVSLRDLFRRPATIAARASDALALHAPSDVADEQARALVGERAYAGPFGRSVRRAIEDQMAIQEIVKSLSPADRAQLPDIEPTLKSLVDRVVAIVQALHTLDADVSPDQIARLDARLAEAKALAEGTADRGRRIALLERQRASLAELVNRRATLADQLESATLVLQTMRLDLIRLRSAGIGTAAADITSVTQEARAVSQDIGRVLDAAAEVRKIQ